MVRKNAIVINETIDVMDLNELKKAIIDRIQQVDDVELLKELLEILEDMTAAPPKMYKLTDEQKRQIKEAQDQIARGECFTDEEVNREEDEWLKES